MKEYKTEQIRNLVLIGHGGTGKTSLAEAALFASGAITRQGKVDDGTTTSDFEPDEVKRKISLSLSLVPIEWAGHKINLIDTPGYADFVGEVKSGIRAADVAAVVVDAVSGVQVGTQMTWMHADQERMPRLIFINRMDRENANFEQAVQQLQAQYGKKVAPLMLPIGSQDSFSGVVNLLDGKAYTGDKGTPGEVPAEMASAVAAARDQLVEAIAEADDDLLEKYLEGGEMTEEELAGALRKGIASGIVYPVFAGSAAKNIGITKFLDAVVADCPSPADVAPETAKAASGDEPLKADAAAPLAAFVFKTAADQFVGRLNYLRVLSGTLRADSHVWNVNHGGIDERLGQLITMRGKTQEHTPALVAGDIGAVAKLAQTVTGDTLSTKEHPLTATPVVYPRPPFNVAVTPKGKADVEKLGPSLHRIAEEDPTLVVHRDDTTGETIISGMGETHVEVAAEKMKRKFGVEVDLHPPKVPYRETVTTKVEQEYIHKKQTGGHGQYARVAITVEPNRGGGYEFVDKVVGGSVPRNYIPVVEKGVHDALHEGPLAHVPMVDLRVTLFDGKEHPVDSSEMAFKLADEALKQGAAKANPVLLEPVVTMKIRVPDANTGDVMSDLNGKRAKVHGMSPDDSGMTIIDAEAPLAEVLRYATDLRSITQGRGTFEMEFHDYDEVPQHIAQKVIAEAQKAREAATHA